MHPGRHLKPTPYDLDHVKWLTYEGLSEFLGKRCLDLGCGSGYLSEAQALSGSTLAVGIDVVPVRYPDAKPGEGRAPIFLQADLNNVSWMPAGFQDGQMQGFDLITAFDIIEHLNSPWMFLKACRSLLSPSGKLLVTTPNASSWEKWLNPANWSGELDPDHRIIFTPYTLKFLLRRAGFEVTHIGAPLRKLGSFGRWLGPIGGQIVVASAPAVSGARTKI